MMSQRFHIPAQQNHAYIYVRISPPYNYNKANNTEVKTLPSVNGIDSNRARALLVVPGTGNKCFASSACWAADSYKGRVRNKTRLDSDSVDVP
jgi:hypothetical protein